MTIESIYLIGSLRNDRVLELGNAIRELGIEAFDDWHSAGPEADDWWKHDNQKKGLTYREALQGWAAKHVFEFDQFHLNRCDAALLLLPAGKSGHLELGYAAGLGKPTFILDLEGNGEGDRWDVMYQFASEGVYSSLQEFLDNLMPKES